MNAPTVAGLDEQSHVGIHERYGHGDIGAIRKNELRVVAELLDEREDVIPTTAVQSGAVVTQFIDDL